MAKFKRKIDEEIISSDSIRSLFQHNFSINELIVQAQAFIESLNDVQEKIQAHSDSVSKRLFITAFYAWLKDYQNFTLDMIPFIHMLLEGKFLKFSDEKKKLICIG